MYFRIGTGYVALPISEKGNSLVSSSCETRDRDAPQAADGISDDTHVTALALPRKRSSSEKQSAPSDEASGEVEEAVTHH